MVRRWSLAVVVIAAVVLLSPMLGVVDVDPVWVVAAAVVAAVALVVGSAARRDARDADSEGESVWELVPSWQYTGRHVESGGLARDEQEAALADLEEQARARRGHRDGRNEG
jgi:hypothetical protein